MHVIHIHEEMFIILVLVKTSKVKHWKYVCIYIFQQWKSIYIHEHF